MKPARFCPTLFLSTALLLVHVHHVRAALTIASGLGTTHTNNLVVNGSFEIGAPPLNGFGNVYNFADSSASNYSPLPNWITSGPGASAPWGNDGPSPYRLAASDVLPDGRVAVNLHTSTGVTVNLPPTFNANGTVTFPGTPVFSGGTPVVLRQSIPTNLFPQPSYNLSFWVSGEESSTVQGFNGAGIIGLRVTNTLPGNPIQWLAVPNGLVYGNSILYEFTFTPLNALLPVEVGFVHFGSLNLTPYGGSAFGVQPILDDVIVNAVPEPSTITLLSIGALACAFLARKRPGRRNKCSL